MKNIQMVGNTHFDPVWTWKWEEAMSDIHSTFRSALDRMNEDASFIYSFATPPVFEWIKKIDPDMFEEIKARVAEDRWELSEGWWVQPDCFSACGESYARQSLYGQRYLMDNFGKYARSVFNIDSFGHNSQIPQILKKSHMDYYCMCRPERYFFPLPSPYFWWVAKDGSKVKAYRVGQYSAIYDKDIERNVNLAESRMEDATADEMMLYGVSNHGGAPTKQAIASIHRLAEEKPYNITFSSVEKYFESQEDPTLVVDSEMITKNFGPYVNDRKVKTLNRLAEYAVTNAEKAAVITKRMLKAPYEGEKLTRCWKDILFNSFHDILGGACTKDAYFDAYNQLRGAIFVANEVMHLNLHSINKKINTPGTNPGTMWNLVVWNLNETDYDGYLEGEIQWLHEFPAYCGGLLLEDELGNQFPCQIILEKSVIKGFRSRVLFKAQIPAMGYKLFKVIQIGDIDKTRTHALKLETDAFKVEIDENTGLISKIYSKVLDKTFTDLLKPQCFEDLSDAEGFLNTTYGKELENFSLINIETVEQGILRTVLKANYKFRNSMLSLYYSFYKDTDYFDVKYRVNWNESQIAFKLLFTTDYHRTTIASPFASETRGDCESDTPMGEWLSIYNENEGISLMADSVFAYTKHEGTLGLSILRSCIYTDLRMDKNPLPNEDYDIMEQGVSEGNLRIHIHKGGFVGTRVFDMARAFNNKPLVMCEPNHNGSYPSFRSFVSVNSKSVLLTALKKAEDDDSEIIRISEIAGEKQEITLMYFETEFNLSINPYEIKTLKINGNNICEVNITED